ADARRLAVQAGSHMRSALDLALLLAVAAERTDSGPDTQAALLEAVQRLPNLLGMSRVAPPPLRSSALSPDGKLRATFGQDAKVRLIDARSGAPLGRPLIGHEKVVRTVAFSPDGKLLASGSDDGTVRLWSVETGQPLGQPLSQQ